MTDTESSEAREEVSEDSEMHGTAEKSRGEVDESPEKSKSLYSHASISEGTAYESNEAQRETPYRITPKKTAAKKTAIIGGLEKAVSGASASEEGGNAHYTTIKPILSLAERSEAAHDNYSNGNTDSDEDNDTQNGAVAIICHRDKGELEFLFEQKPLEAGGKLSLVGGHTQKGESSIDALVRELAEEIEPPAAQIVIKSLDKYSFYQRLPFEYDGIKGYTDIYVIEILHEASWNAVKHAVFQHDAGSPRVLKQHELHVDDFAFGYGEVVKKFADYNSKVGRKSHSDVVHLTNSHGHLHLCKNLFAPIYADNSYLVQSQFPSLALSNIASLSSVQPYNASMQYGQNRLAA